MATSEIFMLLALVSTGIFLLQFVISIFFGGLDIDVDGDTNVDFDLGSLFSFKGLIHFLIGFGWTKVLFVGDAWYTYALAVVSESGRTDYKTDEVVTVKEYRDNKYFIG